MMKKSSESGKLDRKTIEKNRRIYMKDLCSKLAFLIPPQHFVSSSKNLYSQQALLESAASYIKHMKYRVEELKQKKEQSRRRCSNVVGIHHEASTNIINKNERVMVGSNLPLIEYREMGSAFEVTLISGLNKNFMLHEVIAVLLEEGADVVSVNFSAVDDLIFHTIHSQVMIARVGVETTKLWQRLQELIYRKPIFTSN